MTHRTSLCAFNPRRALLLALTLLLAGPAHAGERPYEIGGAQQELGHARELAERLSKQNLFYQLHLGDQTKQDIEDTSAELDRVLELIRKGSPTYSVAAPPNAAIRTQVDRVDKAWAPVRRLAVASPYDYLRRANEFVPRQNRFGDPLFIHSFDTMTQAFLVEVDRLMALYQEECMKTDYELCELAADHGMPTMLNERLVKELVFVYTGAGGGKDVGGLRETRDAIDAIYLEWGQVVIMREATDPSRGDAAAFVSSLWGSINEDWSRIRPEVDLAIGGRAEDINLKRVLEIQRRSVETWERLTAVMVRFTNAKYAP